MSIIDSAEAYRAVESLALTRRTEGITFASSARTDIRLFVTLVRFDAVYHGHFKCNLRRIVDYPNLQGYLCDLYQQPGIAQTVNFDHIKRHYYMTHEDINPTRIVPLGPLLDLTRPHGRERLQARPQELRGGARDLIWNSETQEKGL